MRRAWLLVGLVAGAVGACTGARATVGNRVLPSVSPSGPAFTYVAIGASETAGVGADDGQKLLLRALARHGIDSPLLTR